MLSELVTNAFEHGQGDIGVRILVTGGRLRLEITDGSPTAAAVRRAGPDDESGRGMFIVAALAEEWGTSDDGTVTWCTLVLPERG